MMTTTILTVTEVTLPDGSKAVSVVAIEDNAENDAPLVYTGEAAAIVAARAITRTQPQLLTEAGEAAAGLVMAKRSKPQ